MTKSASAYLVAVHVLVDTNGVNPRSDVIAALEAHLDHLPGQVPAAVQSSTGPLPARISRDR